MSLGMIGQKAGMTRIFDSAGISVPVTVISVTPNQITQIKTLDTDGYKAVQSRMALKKNQKQIKQYWAITKKHQLNLEKV
jgi:large subunit ribosomal protein L3